MSADISRVRFDPLRDFSGAVLQQGTLLLDADFNEYVALLERRLRAQTIDLTSFGPDPDRAGEAWVPRQTPDGSDATAAAAGRVRPVGGDEADGDDPCERPPEGGDRGRGNQTYRVAVDGGGAAGRATFKWSRASGPVAIRVVELVSTTVLRL